MLEPVHLRDLALDPAAGRTHLSAASGLVRLGDRLYVVADDELHLGVLDLAAPADAPLRLLPLRAGVLPGEPAARKAAKPDLEALVALPGDALLALGSGSRPNRNSAFYWPSVEGGPGLPHAVDLAALYADARGALPDLNIEGAFAADGELHLLNRANGGGALNARLSYALEAFSAWLLRGGSPPRARVQPFDIGAVDGIPLGFTDGAALPGGGWLFSAVAEDTMDSYADGPCAASVLGWVSADGVVQRVERIAGAPKVEGIALSHDGDLFMVTDADDAARAARLLKVSLTGRGRRQ